MGSWATSAAWALSLALIDGWQRGFAGRLTTRDEYLYEVPGITDMIPAAQTLLIGFDPHQISAAALAAELAPRDLSARAATTGREIEIPVDYNGQDLDEGDGAAIERLSDLSIAARSDAEVLLFDMAR